MEQTIGEMPFKKQIINGTPHISIFYKCIFTTKININSRGVAIYRFSLYLSIEIDFTAIIVRL